MVEKIRNENGPLLLLESGGAFSVVDKDFRLTARYMVRGMDQMGYTAMNLGGSELYAGADFLGEVTTGMRFPLLSSNLVLKDGQEPLWKPYVLTNLGNVKVGIVGVMPADGLKNIADPKYSENLKILPPKEALDALIPALKKEADVIVLLSQCDLDETTALVDAVKGIDFAICPGARLAGCADHGPQQSETDMLHPARNGVSMGFLQFTLNGSGQAQPIEQKMIALNTPVPAERLMGEMFNEIRKLRIETGTAAREAQVRAMSTLQLTPEEFFKQLQKEQTGELLIKE
ncbi:MAG: bifunctional metallophosphatase/5'-nucleotidase [Desulfobacteraceae bacterium]|jgi:2',3'-cyclic-nucleotide 2'-phosphodiesterase (5'-nucleotidase family)|nr:MAG: bifunctional metallophosphatase/5'-nucleotidase [Desulfobacteraceae bacterium]